MTVVLCSCVSLAWAASPGELGAPCVMMPTDLPGGVTGDQAGELTDELTVCVTPECMQCVCEQLPECCDGLWHAGCVELSELEQCQGACEGGSSGQIGDCCASTGGEGCVEPLCQDCVCAADPFCCSVGWDPSCADRAVGRCWEECECAAAPVGPAECAFPNGCVGASVPSPDGLCVPLQTGIELSAPACGNGGNWDFALCQAGSPTSTVWFVDDNASLGGNGSVVAPFSTISAAVAGSAPGDTICIAHGVYEETVTVDRRLRLVGACPQTTSIEHGSIRVVAAQQVQVHQLAVRFGALGGISLVGGTYLTVRNCLLEENRPANLLAHDSMTGGIPGPEPSQCGCGLQRNLDLCRLTVRAAGSGGDGIRAARVDDIRVLQSLVQANPGTGILTDHDRIAIAGSRFVENRMAVAIRNPRETVTVFNNDVDYNLQGGVAVLRSSSAAPAVTVRVDGNRIEGNGGWGVTVLDTSGSGTPSLAVVKSNSIGQSRRAGVLVADVEADIQYNTVTSTYAASSSANPMGTGRGIEVQRPSHASRVIFNSSKSNQGAGLLFVAPDPGVLSAAEVMDVTENECSDNELYGMVFSAGNPDAPPTFSCQESGGVIPCPTVHLDSNEGVRNGGAALYGQFGSMYLLATDNLWKDTAPLTQPVGTFSYSAAMNGSAFDLHGNTSSFQGVPTAHILVGDAVATSRIGTNTYSSTGTPPEVALNTGTAAELQIPPGVFVVPNASLPMPCPLYPSPVAEDAAIIESL